MNFGTRTRERIQQVAGAVRKFLQPDNEEPPVFAVTHCYPTRLLLYAAAFQGGWKVHFKKSLREAALASSAARPKAVCYDRNDGDPAWNHYCFTLAQEGVPFVVVAHKGNDDAFLAVLAAGGYLASGDPLTSEEILKAVDLAGEMAELGRIPVM